MCWKLPPPFSCRKSPAGVFKKFTQGAMFLPNFISWVVVGAIAYNLLSYDFGFVNNVLTSMGQEKWSVNTDPAFGPESSFSSALEACGVRLHRVPGGNYGISQDIYESAALDGANEWQKIRYITLPDCNPPSLFC
jgi:putative aldouronate transport system permease protein